LLARGKQPDAVGPLDAAHETERLRTINARRVVIAAGTIGTTYLLLQNESALDIADVRDRNDDQLKVLGSRFSGNGDFLAFVRSAFGRLDCTRGPVITAYRRYDAETDMPETDHDAPDLRGVNTNETRHGMYIQDAGFPTFAAWLVQLAQTPTTLMNAARVFAQKKIDGDDSNFSAEINKIMANGEFSSKFMPLLGMGRDRPDGRFSLNRKGKLRLEWKVDTSESYYLKMKQRMTTIARGFSGKILANPLYEMPFYRGITVHPVGGCPMDTNINPGIVDTFGRLRGVDGMRVCDGSVFPGPIGPNPSLTIAAFARRSAHNLLEEPDFAAPPAPADPYDGD
jgi:cholesterol oxidase